jgi:sirohydrochlorin ferrochelatase
MKKYISSLLSSLFIIFSAITLMASDFAVMPGNHPEQSHKSEITAGSQRPGLLILSHGSPMAQWNSPVNSILEKVRQLNGKKKIFHAIEGAFLEFAQPDAAAAVEKLTKAGCDRIVVLPLFIAPSSHSHFDVPAVLGLYSSAEMRHILEEEGARIAKPTIPVTMTETLSEGDLLDRFARDEVKAFSKNPKDEAVVIIAHGCTDHHHLVEKMTRRITTYCCGQTGVDYGDWGFCEVGQSFWQEAATAIARAGQHKKRVLVVGLYVSSSADRIYSRALHSAKGPMGTKFKNPFDGLDITFSKNGLVNHPATVQWILETAAKAI